MKDPATVVGGPEVPFGVSVAIRQLLVVRGGSIMDRARSDRRAFLKALAAMVAAANGFADTAIADETGFADLLISIDGNMPRNGDETGRLTDRDFGFIWDYVEWLGRTFELSGGAVRNELRPNRLRWLLDLRTQTAPSYLREYQACSRMLAYVDEGPPVSTYIALTFRQPPPPVGSALSRFHSVCRDDLLELLLVHGGFRRFGLHNYPGYMSRHFLHPDTPYPPAEALTPGG